MYAPGSSTEMCPGEGKYAPSLRVWAEGDRRLEPKNALLLHIDMPLCSRCAQDISLQQVLSDEGFEQIRNSILSMNRVAPARDSVQLEIESIWDNERVAVFSTPERKNQNG